MSLAIIQRGHGGTDMFEIVARELEAPRAGEIRVRHTAIGVNYHDIYVRKGTSGTLQLPGIPGIEAAGIVEDIGEGVEDIGVGQRIAYITPTYGCYAEHANIPASYAMPIPASLGDAPAAASMLKALTVRMLLEQSYPVRAGQTILVHAASGGTGQLLCQWAKAIGAMVIGTVSTADRAGPARQAGVDHVIARSDGRLVETVNEITCGEGVSAVYDAIGADTIDQSFECLGYGGTLVSYGQVSGAPAPIEQATLGRRSLSFCRPVIFHFQRTDAQRQESRRAVFKAFGEGWLRPMEPMIFPFRDVARAQQALENREGPGGIILKP